MSSRRSDSPAVPGTWSGSAAPLQLYGREVELAMVEALVSGSSAARGMSISGSAGIGKSSVWAHGVARAREAGCHVVTTACAEAEADMPYVALSDLLDDALDEFGHSLSPARRTALDHALLRGDSCGTTESRSVVLAVLELFRLAAERRPVLVAVDDRQWLDAETDRCLAFVARRMVPTDLRLLLARRERSALSGPGPDDGGQRLVENSVKLGEVRLAPLDWVAARALVRDRLDIRLSAEAARSLVTATGGVPFWILEFARTFAQGDEGTAPPTLEALARTRFDGLPADVLTAAALVAAHGRPTFGTVRRALPELAESLEGVLDEATTAGLIAVERDRIVPGHPIVGAALLAAVPPFRRRRLHEQAAELAETAEERANHLLQAEELPQPDDLPDASRRQRLIEALGEAAESAERRGAPASAARFVHRSWFYEQRWRHGPGDGVARLVHAAELYYRAGEFDRAHEFAGRLALRDVADDDLFERVLLLRSGLRPHLIEPARDELPAAEEAATDRRRTAVAIVCSVPAGNERLTRCVELEQAARRHGVSPRIRRRALAAVVRARLDAGYPVDDDLDELRKLDVTAPVGAALDATDVLEAQALLNADRLDEARVLLTEALDGFSAAGDEVGVAWAVSAIGYVEFSVGRPSDATAVLDRWFGPAGPPGAQSAGVFTLRGLVNLVEGRFEALAHQLQAAERAEAGFRHHGRAECLRGVLAMQQGDLDAAVAHFERYLQAEDAAGVTDPNRRLAVDVMLADACVTSGRLDRAAELAEHLELMGVRSGRAASRGSGRRTMARVALARGDLDLAEKLAGEAVGLHEGTARLPELALSLRVLGECRQAAGRPAEARAALGRSRELFLAAGYQRLGAEVSWASDVVASLTSAEREVAVRVAGGDHNRDAAKALHLSVRTVENHLRHIYRKLGIHTRAELADLLTGKTT